MNSQFIKDYGEMISITLIPFILWGLGVYFQNRQEKRRAQIELFLTLFAYRSDPVQKEFTKALNEIDVVFYKSPRVLSSWHLYHSTLQSQNTEENRKIWYNQRIDLMAQMAKVLGYGDLKSLDIKSGYHPQAYDDIHAHESNLKMAALEYLQKGNAFYDVLIANAQQSQNLDSPAKKEGE